MEDHSCEQQSHFNGIGDLEESFGERNHQYESIADRRHGGTRDFALREKIKAKEEAQFNHPAVQDKVSNINNKRKRTYQLARLTSRQHDAAEKRRKRYEARQNVMDIVVDINSPLTSLRDQRRQILIDGNLN
jgi:hypothetical protein